MENLKLSVIICTYNRAKLLPEALDSVLNQKTDFDFEVIVGDDASTDGTRELLSGYQKKFPQKIVLSLMEKNCGIGANWATALMKARGKYVAFLDDDDYWTDDFDTGDWRQFFRGNEGKPKARRGAGRNADQGKPKKKGRR